MKTIVLGDIHANLPALEACYEQAEREGFDWLVHTGDVVGYGPFPVECATFLRERAVPGVRGNFDDSIGWGNDESGARDPDAAERALAEASFRWTGRRIDLRSRRWLADLPFEIRRRDGARTLVIYHAGPIDLYSSLYADTPEPRFVEYGEAAEADVVILGHVHRPFHRKVRGWDFVNAGSVGRPRDGNPHTGYAVIETDGQVRVTFRRFAYDLDRAQRAVRELGLPEPLADRLSRGA